MCDLSGRISGSGTVPIALWFKEREVFVVAWEFLTGWPPFSQDQNN